MSSQVVGAQDWPHRHPSVSSQGACHPVTTASWAVLMSYQVKHGFCSVLSHSAELGALFDSVSSHRLGLGSQCSVSPPHTRVLSARLPPTDSTTAAKAQARVPARPSPGSTHTPTPTPPPEAAFASSVPHQDPSHAVPMWVLNTATSIHISPAVTGHTAFPPQPKGASPRWTPGLKRPAVRPRGAWLSTPHPAVQVHGDPVPRARP